MNTATVLEPSNIKPTGLVLWPAAAALLLCVVDMVLRVKLNPWEGWPILLHDPGKTFFHLFVLPATLIVLCTGHRWHGDHGDLANIPAKLGLYALIIVAVAAAAVETRNSFVNRLTAAEDLSCMESRGQITATDIVCPEPRQQLATHRVELRKTLGDEASRVAARDASNKLAAQLVRDTIARSGSLLEAMSARRLTGALLAAVGFGASAYILWLLAASATGVLPWASTRGTLYLAILLMGTWPMLNGYSEIWRNFGVEPASNPAQGLAVGMLVFAGLLASIAFYKFEITDLLPRLVDAIKHLSSGLPAAFAYYLADPTRVFPIFVNDDFNFAIGQLIGGSLLVMLVLVVEARIRAGIRVNPGGGHGK